MFTVTVLFIATLTSATVPFPDKINVSEPTKLLNVKSLELAMDVPSYSRLPNEFSAR